MLARKIEEDPEDWREKMWRIRWKVVRSWTFGAEDVSILLNWESSSLGVKEVDRCLLQYATLVKTQ
jgi:hypothetical protein